MKNDISPANPTGKNSPNSVIIYIKPTKKRKHFKRTTKTSHHSRHSKQPTINYQEKNKLSPPQQKMHLSLANVCSLFSPRF